VDLPRLLLRLASERRKSEADSENNREPDQPHTAGKSSRPPRGAPAPRPGLHRGPARIDRNRIGVNCSAPTRPRGKGESVSSRTSQDWATAFIHVSTLRHHRPRAEGPEITGAEGAQGAGSDEGAGTRQSTSTRDARPVCDR